MATKKKEDSKKKGSEKVKDEAKEAKRKARMEALKNRPAEQRPNSKQIDVIAIDDKSKVMNYGYAVKNKEGYQGVVVTSILVTADGKAISTSVAFVPGNFTVKSKKGHGVITSPKSKKEKEDNSEEESED
jgi:Na+-translocating ferredoxin:NAD+ oxidoreductase RnfG subunit